MSLRIVNTVFLLLGDMPLKSLGTLGEDDLVITYFFLCNNYLQIPDNDKYTMTENDLKLLHKIVDIYELAYG